MNLLLVIAVTEFREQYRNREHSVKKNNASAHELILARSGPDRVRGRHDRAATVPLVER